MNASYLLGSVIRQPGDLLSQSAERGTWPSILKKLVILVPHVHRMIANDFMLVGI